MRILSGLLITLLLISAPAGAAAKDRPGGLPADLNPGELRVTARAGTAPAEPLQLPLQHTEVHIQVTGFVARATVTQQYTNPFAEPIEAVYVFPLPHQAAVDDMTMRIGDKTIRGEIKEREAARRIYRQALQEGRRAGLLEQERPNIFTQSVGNILPGDEIRIQISYVDILDYRDDGAFELVFPMVVGPRYIPGTPTGPDGTDQVPDASRISPPVLRPGERSGHDIALTVALDAGLEIHGIHSSSHAVEITEQGGNRRQIRLHPSDTLPNKDFILRYQVAGDAPELAVISHHDPRQGGYFTLLALPQRVVDDAATVARDLIFILDTSGSMRGQPLEASRRAMDRLISGMRPGDRFNVVRFAGDTGTLWSAPRAHSQEHIAAARAFVAGLRGGGGTELRRGLLEALGQPSGAGRIRIAVLLTDGYVGNDEEILRTIEQERRGARVFTLGVGSSVNRALLDRAADVGRGEAFYLRQDEAAATVIERFFRRVDRPNLADLEIDWNGLDVTDLTPARLPDLWAGQPLRLHGRYRQGGTARVTVRGLLGSQPYQRSLTVTLPRNQPDNALMAKVWARARVRELMLERVRSGASREALQAQVTALGLKYRMLTQWTAFVAVEERQVRQDGTLRRVVQPVELPEGMDYEGVFGDLAPSPAPVAPITRMRSSVFQGLGGAKTAAPPAAAAVSAEPEPERAEATAPTEEMPARLPCRWEALSVSGGLRYPQVVRNLQSAWPSLCRTLAGQQGQPPRLTLVLELAGDGSVARVRVQDPGTVPKSLEQALQQAFGGLHFGPVAAGGQGRIQFVLIFG
jgi:Ca-activated chloride channel family protein